MENNDRQELAEHAERIRDEIKVLIDRAEAVTGDRPPIDVVFAAASLDRWAARLRAR